VSLIFEFGWTSRRNLLKDQVSCHILWPNHQRWRF
jgi:hypothetical protein